MTHQDPHSHSADAVHDHHAVEAQYVRQGRGGRRILIILLLSAGAAAVLLIGAGLLLELLLWKARTPLVRLALAGTVVLAVLVIWAEAAVGIF